MKQQRWGETSKGQPGQTATGLVGERRGTRLLCFLLSASLSRLAAAASASPVNNNRHKARMAEVEDDTKKYEPLTEDLVREALRRDKGEDAQLVSWKYKDFTKKGDNYACFVTSVEVQYKEEEHGASMEITYVAKLAHQIASPLTELMNEVFQKEGTCFMEILPKMNEVLKELDIDSIRTAKGYAMSLKLGKEVLLLEDLRQREFKMFDRRRGIDVPHALLVLKELGRLHATSRLVEKKLGCSLLETWPVIFERWLEDDDVPGAEMFQKMIESQMETAAMVMEKIPNYEQVVAWIRSTKARGICIFKESLKQNAKFDALTHGDCWNNNILFRYDEAGAPVELMLVDLQGMRKASVAADLSYFLYSSFTGDVRKSNLKFFMETYYDSYCSVLRAAQVPIPFSLEELLVEFRDKMTMGCISGMILAPIVLSEEEDVQNFMEFTEETIDKTNRERQEIVLKMSKREGGQLQDRFLSMFNEMVEAGIVPNEDAAA
ncbi:hypothetical protein O3P69_002085 [Scylla paramamosain]|uniref:CHK kinase-like domain-containing protein n=1 Tax=Scylla paramamosain TaxID=85552 RepID=A0AAW0V524_SCYPA